MNYLRPLVAAAVLMAWARIGAAQPRAIDPAKSTLTVHVGRTGAFSAFGHDHEIAVPIDRGEVDISAKRVELHIRADALRVRDPGGSGKDREQIQTTMSGPAVLDPERYPEIVFQSTDVEPAKAGAWIVRGNLTLHGQTRPVSVSVGEKGGHYLGTAVLKQTDFGIAPVRIAGGAVRVKDDVQVRFDIQLTQ